MGHTHNHSHNHGVNHNKSFAIGIVLNIVFIIVELFYGWIANSSALIADAGHNSSDVLGLVFAWVAIWLAGKKPKGRYTYGYKKSTILISVLNAMILFVAVGFILWDAIGKFKNPEPVAGTQVMIVAGIGFFINAITALMFMKGQKDDLNIRGAFLHMAADAAVSLGVVIAGLLIRYTGANWIDPVMSLIIVGVIVWGTWKLFIDAVNLALDAAPRGIDMNKLSKVLMAQKDVLKIHDLHLWALSTTENAVSVHLVANTINPDQLLNDTKRILQENFNLTHTTIQIEKENNSFICEQC